MAKTKVHPQVALFPPPPPPPPPPPSSSSISYHTSKQETFTVWLKSLVLNGKGCTVFDSNGRIVYRIDNYNCKASNEIFLMDLKGNVLFTILRKQWKLLGFWEGSRAPSTSGGAQEDSKSKKRPGFQVRKTLVGMFGGGDSTCKVTSELDENNQQSDHEFKIQSWSNNYSICKIVDRGCHCRGKKKAIELWNCTG